MHLNSLDYEYPESAIATEPSDSYRTLLSVADAAPKEISHGEIFSRFKAGDLLVVNDTKVTPRRLFAESGEEVLFTKALPEPGEWEALFPARKLKVGDKVKLPGGIEMELLEKGIPQRVRLSKGADDKYFDKYGELALPPYIQRARGNRNMKPEDRKWYQTDWARESGSCAAPTASLHFSEDDLSQLRARGVKVEPVTLHVGIGTFLPIRTDNIEEHVMHEEWGRVPAETATAFAEAKKSGGRVWALGTTVTRTLESWQQGMLAEDFDGGFSGGTRLFIKPGYEFKAVDVLMTNFHQPKSTLLALVCAFAGHDRVMGVY